MSYWFQSNAATSDFRYPTAAKTIARQPNAVLQQQTIARTASRPVKSTRRAAAESRFGDPATLTAKERMRREDLVGEINRSHAVQRLSEWYSRQHAGQRAGQRQRNELILRSELAIAGEELKNIRRAKLKEKLLAEQKNIEMELAMKGLAILNQMD